MDDRDQRATELIQLKRDLAEFELRLNAFEARRKGQPRTISTKAPTPIAPDREFAKQIVLAIKGVNHI
jgi:hypothetical protein